MTQTAPVGEERAPDPRIDTTVPQTARIWNYWLGGNDNYAVDRAIGDQVLAVSPGIVAGARAQRAFLVRAVRYLAGEVGIRQFLDVGTGLPSANNTHEVAQSITPESRIVYVDFDPIVLVHARALLTSNDLGATNYIDADARDTDTVLREAAKTLDFREPVAVMLLGVLGHIDGYEEGKAVVRQFADALAPGSYVAIGDGTNTSPGMIEAAKIWNQSATPRYHVRSPEQLAGYLEDLEMVEPGVVCFPLWHPDPDQPDPAADVDGYGGLARKP